MNKAAILVEDQYQVLEVWYPYLRLREEGIEAVLVGTGAKKEYKSKEGYPAPEELSIEKAKADDFTVVVIPGGYAPDILRRYPKINNFVREMDKAKRIVASICHGGLGFSFRRNTKRKEGNRLLGYQRGSDKCRS